MGSRRITMLNDGGASRDGDWLVVARDGENYKINAGAAGLGALHSVNNLSDVADAAASLANLGGVPLSGDRALQLYGATIVDPFGEGDYTNLTDAVANTPVNGHIYVVRSISEAATVVIDKRLTIFLGHAVQIGGPNFSTALEIQGVSNVVTFIGDESILLGAFADAIHITGSAGTRVELYNVNVLGLGGDGIIVDDAACGIIARNCSIGGTTALDVPGQLASATEFRNVGFTGSLTSTASWTDAPFYNCTFTGTLTNISPSLLSASNDRIVSGVATTVGYRGLSIYAGSGPAGTGNTVTVDPSGRGDYTSIAAAVSATVTNDIIRVFGQQAPSSTINISGGRIIYFEPGAFIVANVLNAPLFDVTGSGTILYLWGPSGIVINISGQVVRAGADTSLHINGPYIQSSTDDTIEITSATVTLTLKNTEFGGTFDSGFVVPAALSAPSTIIQNCIFRGSTYSVSSAVAWANAPFYHCTFIGSRNNITFAAGNNSNVDV